MQENPEKGGSMGELLERLMDGEGVREQMLLAVLDKARGGDMKAMEFVREMLGEQWRGEGAAVEIRLGKGVEELCK